MFLCSWWAARVMVVSGCNIAFLPPNATIWGGIVLSVCDTGMGASVVSFNLSCNCSR